MKELARGGTVRQWQSWDLNPVAVLAAEPKLSVPCHGGLSQTDGWTAPGQGEKGTFLTGRQTARPCAGFLACYTAQHVSKLHAGKLGSQSAERTQELKSEAKLSPTNAQSLSNPAGRPWGSGGRHTCLGQERRAVAGCETRAQAPLPHRPADWQLLRVHCARCGFSFSVTSLTALVG